MTWRNDYFTFISYVVREGNKLSAEIGNSTSYQQFRKSLLFFIKPTCFTLFSIHHSVGVRLLVRLRLDFSRLHEDKFRHNVLAASSLKQLHTIFYCCHNSPFARSALMNDLNIIDPTISQ